jgi:hypothetical protein
LDQARFHGISTLLIGLSEIPLAYVFFAEQVLPRFVLISSGLLLTNIGLNLLRGRTAFENPWHADGKHGRIALAFFAIVTVAVVVASVLTVLL